MSDPVSITLNRAQLFGLRAILLDYARNPDATQTWEDVITGQIASLDELLDLVLTPRPSNLRNMRERESHYR